MSKTVEEIKNELKVGKTMLCFHAQWCGSCKMLEPIAKELLENNSDLNCIKIDIDNAEYREFIKEMGADKAVPTMQFFKDNKKISELIGFNTLPVLQKHVDDLK